MLLITYLCSSNTLLAMAFLTVSASSSILQDELDEKDEVQYGVSQGLYSFGNLPFPPEVCQIHHI